MDAFAAEGILSLRRDRLLTRPSPAYTFAQSRPPAAGGQQHVVQRTEKQKVIQTVRKEVQACMSSGSVTLNFSRADYQRITDQVQSLLARRLKIHKERLGLN